MNRKSVTRDVYDLIGEDYVVSDDMIDTLIKDIEAHYIENGVFQVLDFHKILYLPKHRWEYFLERIWGRGLRNCVSFINFFGR